MAKRGINTVNATVAEEDLATKVARLEAELAAAKVAKVATFRLKVSEKGAVTAHGAGLRRFGVTLYQGEWKAVFDNAEKIMSFIKANAKALASLDD